MVNNIDSNEIRQDENGFYTIIDGEKQRVIFVNETQQDLLFKKAQLRECVSLVIEKIEELNSRLADLSWKPHTENTQYFFHRLPLILTEFKNLQTELEQFRE